MPTVSVALRDLAWPHRLDIAARVEALRLYDIKGRPAALASSFAELAQALPGHVGGDRGAAIDALIELYQQHRRTGTRLAPRGITVRRTGRHAVAVAPGDGVPTMPVPDRYDVVDGADEVAVLLHLDVEHVRVPLVDDDGPVHDLTTFMLEHHLAVDPALDAVFPAWPRRIAPAPGDLAEELRIRDAHLARYERRLAEIFGVLGSSVVSTPSRRYLPHRPTLGLAGSGASLARASYRRARRAVAWRVRRLRGGPSADAAAAATAAAPPAEQRPFAFNEAQIAERARQQRRFNLSGEVERLERLRGIHQGERCFIIGNGPSLATQDLTLLRDEKVFVTNWFANHADFAQIRPDYYCISSHEVFGGWSHDAIKMDDGMRTALERACTDVHPDFFFSFAFRDYLDSEGILPGCEKHYLLFDRPKALISAKGDVNLNIAEHRDDGMTGISTFALPLARHMGFTTIYLLGCDSDYGITSPESEKKYFYDFKNHTTRTTSYEGLQRAWADGGPAFQSYEILRRAFERDGIEIVNLTRGGRLEVFPRAAYEDVIG